MQIVIPMLRGERPTVAGDRYAVTEAINEPPAVSRIPVMIGGGGEKKTLRMAAQYADESNIICQPNEVSRKLEALDEHCQQLGRDRSEMTVSWQRTACIAPTTEQAQAELFDYLQRRGLDVASMSDEDRAPWLANFVWGDPDTIGEKFEGFLALGVDGFTVNMPANGHIEGRVELLGQTLSPLVA